MTTTTHKLMALAACCVAALIVQHAGAESIVSHAVPNASFEWPPSTDTWVYTGIEGWTNVWSQTCFGVTRGGHADNGIMPDKRQVAFVATDQAGLWFDDYYSVHIRTIRNFAFEPDTEYCLQFWHNAREAVNEYWTNYCMFLVSVGQDIFGPFTNQAVGVGEPYHFQSIIFTAKFPTARLFFHNLRLPDSSPGIGTLSCLLIDGVSLYKRARPDDIMVKNPSFEASGEQGPGGGVGLINRDEAWQPLFDRMAGWEYWDGGYNDAGFGTGTNSNPYIAPSFVPEGQSAFFDTKSERFYANSEMRTTLSQTIHDLVIGRPYALSYHYNARPGASDMYSPSNFTATIGGIEVHRQEFLPWSPAFYSTTVTFVADWTSMDLVFGTSNSVDGATMLLDNVGIWPLADVSVSITSGAAVVAHDVESYAVAGVSLNTVGGMWVTNASTGGAALSFAAAAAWTAPAIELALGANVITVGGTNVQGDAVTDSAVITRRWPGRSIRIRNASFEWPTNAPGLGMTNIWGWTQSHPQFSGINPCEFGYPFHDNGRRPDKTQVAFLWSFGTDVDLSQTLSGLDPGRQYCLQFWHNAGSISDEWNTNVAEFTVAYAGVTLTTLFSEAVNTGFDFSDPFHFTAIVFTPAASTGALRFRNRYTRSDGSNWISRLVLDTICLYELSYDDEVIVKNPSFEASGEQGPGGGLGFVNVSPAWAPVWDIMAGWEYWDGNYNSAVFGTATNANPYLGSVPVPEGQAMFMDNKSERWYVNADYQTMLQQDIGGLAIGQEYHLSYCFNARPGESNMFSPSNFTVRIGGIEVQRDEFLPWQPQSVFTSVTFVADWTSMKLAFGTSNSADGCTMLIDDVTIWPVPEPLCLMLMGAGLLGLLRVRRH